MKKFTKYAVLILIILLIIILISRGAKGMRGGGSTTEFQFKDHEYRIVMGYKTSEIIISNDTSDIIITVNRDNRTIRKEYETPTFIPKLTNGDFDPSGNLEPYKLQLLLAHLWIDPDNKKLRQYLYRVGVPEHILELFRFYPFLNAHVYINDKPTVGVDIRMHRPTFAYVSTDRNFNTLTSFYPSEREGLLKKRRNVNASDCKTIHDADMFALDYYLGLATTRKGCKIVTYDQD